MPNDDKDSELKGLLPGAGVTDWLAQTVGKPRTSKAGAGTVPAASFFKPAPAARKLVAEFPEEVVVAKSGTLQRLEIRGLPSEVVMSQGSRTDEGFWLLLPDQIYGVAAIVPENEELPFSVMLKGVFVGDDPDTPWSELTGYEFADDTERDAPDSAPEAAAQPDTEAEDGSSKSDNGTELPSDRESSENTPGEPAINAHADSGIPTFESESEIDSPAEPEPAPAVTPDAFADSMTVIDLDVSVGIEDEARLKDITLKFTGLPAGASLSSGTESNGVWTVQATALRELSIIFPEGTPDFDLDIEMNVVGLQPQSATIRVETPPLISDPENTYKIHLAPGAGGDKVRVSIFADGTSVLDSMINWSATNGPLIELPVPYIDNALPFEIVMRYDSFGNDQSAPRLTGIEIDGTFIRADSPAISATGNMEDTGFAWHGDLVVDVRHALKPELPELPEQEQAHQPSELAAPSSDTVDTEEPDSGEETTANPDTVLESAPASVPTMADEPIEDFTEAVDDDEFDPVSATGTGISEMPEPPTEDTGDVLIVDATYRDLQKPAFISELRNLRDFIRTRPSDDSGEIYDRLGIDVTKWHDMIVHGPTGAEVVLDPWLPAIAPKGGIDNTRLPHPLSLSKLAISKDFVVRVTGMPPGSMLSRGRNLGNGCWQLEAVELDNVMVLPPLATRKSLALHLAWDNADQDDNAFSPKKSLVLDRRRLVPLIPGTDMQTIKLPMDAAIFDPNGYGSISMTLGDMPPGAILSQGRNHGGGVWTVELKTGEPLSVIAAAGVKPFSITLTCVALDTNTGDSTVVSRGIEVMPAKSKSRLRDDVAA